MNKFNPQLGLLARVFLGVLFLLSGIGKLQGYEGFQSYMEAGGVPGALAPLVIAVEIIAGAAVIIGFQARLAALLLAGFSVLAAILYHTDFRNQMQIAMFLKDFAIAGGMLLVFIHGPGAYAVGKDK
ncbi:MAG: DoxX family protein [Sphingomonadales bacterium]|jgi:putative oxidoreductase